MVALIGVQFNWLDSHVPVYTKITRLINKILKNYQEIDFFWKFVVQNDRIWFHLFDFYVHKNYVVIFILTKIKSKYLFLVEVKINITPRAR